MPVERPVALAAEPAAGPHPRPAQANQPRRLKRELVATVPGAAMRTSHRAAVLLGLASTGLLTIFGGAEGTLVTNAEASVQQCNTQCQSRMTDCVQACDGQLACELSCKARAESCVRSCAAEATRVRAEGDSTDAGDAVSEVGPLLDAGATDAGSSRDGAHESGKREASAGRTGDARAD